MGMPHGSSPTSSGSARPNIGALRLGALSRRPARGHQQRRAAPNQKAPSRQECRDAVGENLAWADVVRRVEPRIGRSLVRVNGDALLVRRHGCGQRDANHQVGQSVGSSQRIRGTRLFEQDAHPLGKGRGPWQDPILPGCAEPSWSFSAGLARRGGGSAGHIAWVRWARRVMARLPVGFVGLRRSS